MDRVTVAPTWLNNLIKFASNKEFSDLTVEIDETNKTKTDKED